MDILIVLENSNGKIHRMSLEAISAAQNLASEFDLKIAALAMGENANALCEEASRFNLEEIIKVDNDLLLEYSSDGYAETLNQVISRENPKFIFFGHTYQVRDYVPRLSAKLMKPFLADNVAINLSEHSVSCTKQMFNAKLLSDIHTSNSGPFLISFQSAAYSSEEIKSGDCPVRDVSVELETSMIKTKSEKPFKESIDDLDLTSADLIVSVGRGIGKEDNIPLAKNLAQAIGADLSSSRPVVDSGWLPSIHQVGSSGQSVSPKMYLALGISGAIQHVVGMKGSKYIVAINKDPDAPIFEIADYGAVGDLLEILPKLTEAFN